MDRVQRGSPISGDKCYCVLPGNVRIRDVATVLGSLLPVGSREQGVQIVNVSVGYAYLTCPAYNLTAHYAFESDRFDRSGRMLVLGPRRGNPLFIAVGVALVDFFGGTMVASDADDVPIREVSRRTDDENCPENGEPLVAFEARLAAVGRITQTMIDGYSYLCGDGAGGSTS